MKRKYALYPIIMSICALVCFLGVLLVFSGAVQPLWGRMMLLMLPALVLGIVAVCAVKGKMGEAATTVWTTVLSVVFLLASVFYVCILSLWTATATTTDTRYYSRAYAQIDELEAVQEVFPKTVPEDAQDIQFTYFPQFLQGGEEFELSYTATDDALTQWRTLLKRKAEWVGPNQKWHSENNWSFDGTSGTRYQLYWDGGSNHCEICYVLLDEDLSRITFYYSVW